MTERFACAVIVLLASLLASCGPPAESPERLEAAAQAIEAGHAGEAVESLAAIGEKSPAGWSLLAQACAALPCDGGQAVELFGPAARGGDPRLVLLAARAAAAADRIGEAERWLAEASERLSPTRELEIERSKLLARLERYEEAAEVLRPHVGADPRVLNLIGYAELLAGNLDRARGYIERSIAEARAVGRDYAPAHYHLGRYHLAKGDLEAARASFARARDVNPDHLEAQYLEFAVAERLEDASAAGEAREGFARLFAERLAAAEEEIEQNSVSHRDDIEGRHEVSESAFRRALPAGRRIEVAAHVSAGTKARFRAELTTGDDAGRVLLDVTHEAPDTVGSWFPHILDLPEGPAGSELVVAFKVSAPAGLLGFLDGDPPTGAVFSEPAPLPEVASRSADVRPNLLLISLDTLRADRVSAYGAPRRTTPVLDALAARGVRFAQAEAANNWTLPSHYSIFSGLTPAAHGVMPDMGQVRGYLFPDRRLNVRGSGRERMLAEVLTDAGYRTAAVTENGWVSGRFGFDQGFRVYRSDLRGSLPRTLAASLAELEHAGEHGPWFLFVHTYTPHQPYHAPEDFRLRWARRDHIGFAWPRGKVPISDYYRFRAPHFPPAPSDVEAFLDLYDGQVAWADTLVGGLVSWLEERGLAEQTVVAVTSDHGEEIFERGQFDHGDTLYEEVTHVPLILAGPGVSERGSVVEGPVSLVDLPATLLDLARAGDELGQGRSLRPLWEGASPARARRPAFAQAIGLDGAPLSACWDGRYKYVRRGLPGEAAEELFDLDADPAERENLAPARSDVLERMRLLVEAHEAESEAIAEALGSGEEELDEETIERLKSLGYAQ